MDSVRACLHERQHDAGMAGPARGKGGEEGGSFLSGVAAASSGRAAHCGRHASPGGEDWPGPAICSGMAGGDLSFLHCALQRHQEHAGHGCSPVGEVVAGAGKASGLEGFLRPNSALTTTKNSGTKKIASTVAVTMPPTTPVPMACLLPELAPVAITRGITPTVNASDVMMMGRSRRRAASMAASTRARQRLG